MRGECLKLKEIFLFEKGQIYSHLYTWMQEYPCTHSLKIATNQKHYQDLGSDTSSVWNFCTRYSDVVLRGLMW